MPPTRSEGSLGHVRAQSLGGIFESSSDTEGFSSLPSASGPADSFSRHMLSSFVPEYTIAVVALAVVLQGVLLLPGSMFVLTVLEDSGGKWEWLSLDLLSQWWRWTWNAAFWLLFCGLPAAILLVEGKEHRDAPMFKKIAILLGRLGGAVSKFGLAKPLLAMSGLLGLYIMAVMFGLFGPIRVSEWMLLLSTFCVTATSLISVASIPLGLVSLLHGVVRLAVRPDVRQELQQQMREVDDQIDSIESTLSSDIRRGASCELTPVSSKSLRSKLAGLHARSADLHRRSRIMGRPIWKNLLAAFMMGLLGLLILFILYMQCRTLTTFVASHLLWHLPGVQLLDRIMFRLALFFNMVEEQQPAELVISDTLMVGGSWLPSTFMSLIYMFLFYLGLQSLVRKRRLCTIKIITPGPNAEETPIFVMPQRTLDQCLVSSLIALVATVLLAPIVIVSGSTDLVDAELHKGSRLTAYTSQLATLLPRPLRLLIDTLHCANLMRFPLLLWLLVAYRGTLLMSLAVVGLRAFRECSRSLLGSIRGRRPSTALPHQD